MRCGYFDCCSGAAGDMVLGALLDAGCPLDVMQDVVGSLNLPGVSLTAEKVTRGGLAATHARVQVAAEGQPQHRHLAEILDMVTAAGFDSNLSQRIRQVFQRLAKAEAAAHGEPAGQTQNVHFHEVGAADAIVDISCACAGVAELGLETLYCSPILAGHGTVRCAHGVLPVPTPATANLLKGVPLSTCDEPGERCTPTGAAILTTLVPLERFGPPPAMRLEAVGSGAGTRQTGSRPNILRLLIGETADADDAEHDLVVVLEAQVDDATGQAVAYACTRLLEAGALDAHIVPIIMKKGRPGQLLTVLSRPGDVAKLESIVFQETTTFGIRRHECQRSKLAREIVSVATQFGPIRVKIGRRGGELVRMWPEYEDCAAAARKHGVAVRTVQSAALAQAAEEADAADA